MTKKATHHNLSWLKHPFSVEFMFKFKGKHLIRALKMQHIPIASSVRWGYPKKNESENSKDHSHSFFNSIPSPRSPREAVVRFSNTLSANVFYQ